MRTRKYLFLAVISFLLVPAFLMACSTRPSERRAKADLQRWFDGRWPGTISVVAYQKTREEGDDKTYAIDFLAKARFIKDTQGCVQTCCGDVCFEKRITGFRWTSKASEDPHVVKKGDLFEVQGKHTYKKNNNKWTNEDL